MRRWIVSMTMAAMAGLAAGCGGSPGDGNGACHRIAGARYDTLRECGLSPADASRVGSPFVARCGRALPVDEDAERDCLLDIAAGYRCRAEMPPRCLAAVEFDDG